MATELKYITNRSSISELPITEYFSTPKPCKIEQKYHFSDKFQNPTYPYRIKATRHADYYPFGSVIQSRTYSSGAYRFGFNGKEKDNETYEGSLAFEARIFDSRLGRFLTLDPLKEWFDFQSGFVFALNSPLQYIDVNGEGPGDAVRSGEGPAAYAARNGTSLNQLALDNPNVFKNYPKDGTLAEQNAYWSDMSGKNWMIHPGMNLEVSVNHKKATLTSDIPQNQVAIAFDDVKKVDLLTQAIMKTPAVGKFSLTSTSINDDGKKYSYNGTSNLSKPELFNEILFNNVKKHFANPTQAVGVTMVLLGQPNLAKPFVTKGAIFGTSVASSSLRSVFTKMGVEKLSFRVPTLVGGLGTGAPLKVAYTTSLGAAVGRAIPFIGYALIAYDIVSLIYDTWNQYNTAIQPQNKQKWTGFGGGGGFDGGGADGSW